MKAGAVRAWCGEFWMAVREEARRVFCGNFPTWLLLIAVPIGYTLIFGYAYLPGSVNHVPIVIQDADQRSMSRALINMYEDAEKFDIVAQPSEEEDLTAAMEKSEAMAGLAIPKNFARDIKRGDVPHVELFIHSVNNVYGNVITTGAWEINRTYQVAVASKLLEAIGMMPSEAMDATYPIRMGTRIIGNPTVAFGPFVLPILAANGTQIALILTVAPLVVLMLERGTWRQRRFSSALVFGSGCVHGVVAFAAFLVSLGIACAVYDIPMYGAWWQIALIGAGFVFFVIGALSFFGSISPMPVVALQLPIFYIMPGILYSGMAWPDYMMTEGAAFYAALVPITYLAVPLRDLMLTGYAPMFWQDFGILVLGGVITRMLAVTFFHLRQRWTLRAERKTACGEVTA